MNFLHQYEKVTAKSYLSLLNCQNNACDVVPLGTLHLCPLQFYLKCFWRAHRDSLFLIIHLDPLLSKVFAWWENKENLVQGTPLHPEVPSVTILTDASQIRCGHMGDQTISGLWSPTETSFHINVLKMRAVILTLKHFTPTITGKCVLIISDNTTVVSYIKRPPIIIPIPAVTRIGPVATSNQVSLKVTFILSWLNTMVETLCQQGQIIKAKRSLLRQVFQQIHSTFIKRILGRGSNHGLQTSKKVLFVHIPSHFAAFTDWCLERNVNMESIFIQNVADYLYYLFETLNKSQPFVTTEQPYQQL